jgi:catechol 2,3-dioxygenase-like lactoylglutathione lyase family enzyme
MAKVLKVNHTAIVVGDMDAALTFWRDALGLTLEHSEDVTVPRWSWSNPPAVTLAWLNS